MIRARVRGLDRVVDEAAWAAEQNVPAPSPRVDPYQLAREIAEEFEQGTAQMLDVEIDADGDADATVTNDGIAAIERVIRAHLRGRVQ